MRKGFLTAAGGLAFGAMAFATASPAAAAARNGVCEPGEFCLYFNSGNKGSLSDFLGSVADYGAEQPTCYDFKGPGNGKGECVKNAAASVWNRTPKTVRVFYNSGHAGASQDFKSGVRGDLNGTLKNQNASHEVGPSSVGRVALSTALYAAGPGSISCPFDGYTTVPGHHEGIDFVRGVGSAVRSLTSGEITYLKQGANGGGNANLSTIAVYDAAARKTVIYLHTEPRASLRVGRNVSRGQVIADEAWHGVSSRGGAHTHVEMRPGRQTHASKSVGDPVLNNPDPKGFWRSQGYEVK
ncbi:hypothetical protein GCM10022221_19980 [Actinocorallia aurea]